MKKSILKISAILFALAVFTLSACEKTDTSVDTQSAQDDARAQSATADAFAIAGDGGDGGKSMGCDTIILLSEPGTFPKRIKIQFSDEGCDVLENGVIRKGAIYVTFDKIWGEGATLTTTFENYSFDGNKFEGTITGTYNKILPYPEHTITATNCVLTKTDGKTISYNSTQTFKMIEGALTPLILRDNVLEINGSSNGTNAAGVQFSTASIGIIKANGCKFPKAGTVTFGDGAVLNFDEDGDSTNAMVCNSLVKVTKLGISVVVDLQK